MEKVGERLLVKVKVTFYNMAKGHGNFGRIWLKNFYQNNRKKIDYIIYDNYERCDKVLMQYFNNF